MRWIVVVGSLVLAMLSGGAVAQQQTDRDVVNGPKGETIVWSAQVELYRAGLYKGPHNGILTDETAEAIEAFEHHVGWPETGRVTQSLVVALKRFNLVAIVEAPGE